MMPYTEARDVLDAGKATHSVSIGTPMTFIWTREYRYGRFCTYHFRFRYIRASITLRQLQPADARSPNLFFPFCHVSQSRNYFQPAIDGSTLNTLARKFHFKEQNRHSCLGLCSHSRPIRMLDFYDNFHSFLFMVVLKGKARGSPSFWRKGF